MLPGRKPAPTFRLGIHEIGEIERRAFIRIECGTGLGGDGGKLGCDLGRAGKAHPPDAAPECGESRSRLVGAIEDEDEVEPGMTLAQQIRQCQVPADAEAGHGIGRAAQHQLSPERDGGARRGLGLPGAVRDDGRRFDRTACRIASSVSKIVPKRKGSTVAVRKL